MADQEPPEQDGVPTAGSSMAAWLGMLFLLLVLMVAVGGFVRLSGSGLSIPDWPLINGSLLPPFDDAGWQDLRAEYLEDQRRLQAEKAAGAIGLGSLGTVPRDLGEFKLMFMIEWSHRALAAVIGVIVLGCTTVALRRRDLRSKISGLLGATVFFIVCQAVLGGVLVKSGTATQFLFLHLAMTALIMATVLWSILALLRREADEPGPEQIRQRSLLRPLLVACLVCTLGQIVLGALVAGTRADMPVVETWPLMQGEAVPTMLWVEGRPLSWNLLENTVLHQWVHRWFAWILAAVTIGAYAVGRKHLGPRGRAGINLVLGLLVAQIGLGILNVFQAAEHVPLALAHLVTGMLFFASLVLVYHDARHERRDPLAEREAAPEPALEGAG